MILIKYLKYTCLTNRLRKVIHLSNNPSLALTMQLIVIPATHTMFKAQATKLILFRLYLHFKELKPTESAYIQNGKGVSKHTVVYMSMFLI
jgi:hypothetical protein